MVLFSLTEQEVHVYANRPIIRKERGERGHVEDPDLWLASKINSTLKDGYASEVYWEKLALPEERRRSFIEGVRNHSWNRQHMGALVVGNVELELKVSSLVSSAITLGKFYKIQQQTRRSVILKEVAKIESISDNAEVKESLERRFRWYRNIVDKREGKIKGFDRYVQDAFKILPLNVMTRIVGNWDLRTTKGYSRWRNLTYLPSSVRQFGEELHRRTSEEYPLFYQSYLLHERETAENEELILRMAQRIGGDDIMDEPMLWYQDHSFLLPENRYISVLKERFNLDKKMSPDSPDSILVGLFNPLGVRLDDLLELFDTKDEGIKSALEMTQLTFVSRLDLSGAIDTWRHVRNNRIVQPIYDALSRPAICTPELIQRSGDGELLETFLRHSVDSVELYKDLVRDGVPESDAINVLPHSLMLYQVETMDLFSFLNVMGLRTCTHARPDVQKWAKSLLRAAGQTKEFRGIDKVLGDGILAHALQKGYCGELGNCRACGHDIVYLPDPFRGKK